MTVAALCYASREGATPLSVSAVQVVAGAGIVGDRYFVPQRRDRRLEITLIEAEEIEAFNARNGTRLALTDPRRNVVTRGVRLNALVGSEFTVGDVRLRGIELCEPCGTLSRYLASFGLAKRHLVREFMHRCGLRAAILDSGTIRVGDPIALAAAAESAPPP